MPPCIYSAHSQIVPYRSRSIPHKTVLFVYDSRNEKNVGQRVRALREESNLTQEQLALMTGVGRSYLAKVEAGNRNATIDFMEKVALGLGVTLGQLFEGL